MTGLAGLWLPGVAVIDLERIQLWCITDPLAYLLQGSLSRARATPPAAAIPSAWLLVIENAQGVARALERRRRPAETWMSQRSRLRVIEGLEGRSERPARGHGQPRPTQDADSPARPPPCRTGLRHWAS